MNGWLRGGNISRQFSRYTAVCFWLSSVLKPSKGVEAVSVCLIVRLVPQQEKPDRTPATFFPVFCSVRSWHGARLQRCPTTVARLSAFCLTRRWFTLWQVQRWAEIRGDFITLCVTVLKKEPHTYHVVNLKLSVSVSNFIYVVFRAVWLQWRSSFLWIQPKADCRVSWRTYLGL